jgi:hypothetical protein
VTDSVLALQAAAARQHLLNVHGIGMGTAIDALHCISESLFCRLYNGGRYWCARNCQHGYFGTDRCWLSLRLCAPVIIPLPWLGNAFKCRWAQRSGAQARTSSIAAGQIIHFFGPTATDVTRCSCTADRTQFWLGCALRRRQNESRFVYWSLQLLKPYNPS